LPERSQDLAIVVGIEGYGGQLPDARFARRDAESIKAHLMALGYPERNIALLRDGEATLSGIKKHLEVWLRKHVKKDSNVFFYYSGHGAPDVDSGDAYLLPSDGDPGYLPTTGYPLKRVYSKLAELKAGQVIVAIDSCFSGAGGRSVLPKGTRPLVTRVDVGRPVDSIISLTASSSDQISGSIEKEGHGLFTYYLLKGLNGAAKKDGKVTVEGLYEYLLPKVQDIARRDNRSQVPQLTPEDASLRLR